MACWSSVAVAAPERLLAPTVEIATVSASKVKRLIIGELVDIVISRSFETKPFCTTIALLQKKGDEFR
jgi:hypothetical protein